MQYASCLILMEKIANRSWLVNASNALLYKTVPTDQRMKSNFFNLQKLCVITNLSKINRSINVALSFIDWQKKLYSLSC